MAPKSRRLLRREITYSQARDEEVNILRRLDYWPEKNKFINRVFRHQNWIQATVAHHLNVSAQDCDVSLKDSLYGSFNLCIPVTVKKWKGKRQSGNRLMFRLPLPYRVGDAFRPGNGDEKVRCEAGTYAWLEENCPDVPIPRFYGFGVSTGETVSILSFWCYIYNIRNECGADDGLE